MPRLAQTPGLTDVQQEILETVREFVDKEIIPHAQALEHADEYPADIVDGHARDGPVRPHHRRGVRRPRRIAADLRPRRRADRPRLDVRLRHHQHALHRGVPDLAARHRRAEAAVPAADGDRRGTRRVLDVRARPAAPTSPRSRPGRSATATATCSTAQKMWLTNGGSSNLVALLARTDEGAAKPHRNLTTFLLEKRAGLRRGRARPDHPRQDRQDGLQGRRHHRGALRRVHRARRQRPRRHSPAGASTR